MRLKIISPAGIEAEAGNIDAIRTVLADGKPLTILPRHAPLMGELDHARITTKSNDTSKSFDIKRGVMLVKDDLVKILTSGMQGDADA